MASAGSYCDVRLGSGGYTEAGKWTRQATERGEDRGHDDRLFQGFRPILLIYELPLLLNQPSPDRLIDSIVKLRPGASPTDDVPILGDGAEREREIVARLSRLSADVAVFAVGLHLLRRALDEPEKAASYARAMGERCAVISDAPQDFWSGCARLSAICLVPISDGRRCMKRGDFMPRQACRSRAGFSTTVPRCESPMLLRHSDCSWQSSGHWR